MTKKFKIHKSYEERSKQHRNIHRNTAWGSGFVDDVKLSWDMFRPSFWGAWCAIITLWLIVNLLPFKVIIALGKAIGRLMKRFLKGRSYVLQTNLKLAFPNMSEQERNDLENRIFENSGVALFETGMAWFWPNWRIKRIFIVDPEEYAIAKELADKKERVLLLSCHMMSLEMGARMFGQFVAPGIGVYRGSDHPVWEYIQIKGRLRCNAALVERSDARSMVKALMKGLAIWYAPDQDYGPKSAVFVPFFGVDKTCTVTGLHDLARIKDVKVLPFWPTREANGYRIHFMKPLENFPTDNKENDTRLGNEIVEKMIMSAPDQYLWMHRRFKTTPEGEPSRYTEIG